MRFMHVMHEVYSRPWLILPSYHSNIRSIIEMRSTMTAAQWQSRDPAVDVSGNKVAVRGMEIDDNGIATIPVAGVILKGATAFERGMGAVSTEEIAMEVKDAIENPDVEGIFFDIDSPGGTVAGVPELAEMVAMASDHKPTIAWTDGMMCSAAYWVGSQAREIHSSPSADVGSIGVYLPVFDQSEAFAMEGVTVELIKNTEADLKGMGFPGTSLTPEQRENLQQEVEDIATMFKAAVTGARDGLPSESFRGQTFMGRRAVENKMVDRLNTRDGAYESFLENLD